MRILVVEDDPEISTAIRAGLEQSGFHVDIVRDGERAYRVALSKPCSAIVMDRMLPTMDGLTVCRRLREARVTTPILMISAKGELKHRVDGLENGADDYLPKPFALVELLARVRALLRRDKVVKASIITVCDLVIDTAARTVRRGDRVISLTQREYSLLEAMALREGQVLSRSTIQQTIWVDEFSTSNTVDVHIKNLRKKVDGLGEVRLIQTIFGVGYALREAV